MEVEPNAPARDWITGGTKRVVNFEAMVSVAALRGRAASVRSLFINTVVVVVVVVISAARLTDLCAGARRRGNVAGGAGGSIADQSGGGGGQGTNPLRH